jgi:prepilin-type N-terminal cleavage/methylation domain-containing protein
MASTASGGDEMKTTSKLLKTDDRAFTLIELLMVVALIAVLSALTVINFAEAQTRAKVARVRADTRAIVSALETYCADHGVYPAAAIGDVTLQDPLQALTSPRAYLSSVPRDPFGAAPFDFAPSIYLLGYNYKDAVSTSQGMPGETYARIWQELPDKKYMIHSCGPNKRWDVTPYVEYDATNGTSSNGDICCFGPG